MTASRFGFSVQPTASSSTASGPTAPTTVASSTGKIRRQGSVLTSAFSFGVYQLGAAGPRRRRRPYPAMAAECGPDREAVFAIRQLALAVRRSTRDALGQALPPW